MWTATYMDESIGSDTNKNIIPNLLFGWNGFACVTQLIEVLFVSTKDTLRKVVGLSPATSTWSLSVSKVTVRLLLIVK